MVDVVEIRWRRAKRALWAQVVLISLLNLIWALPVVADRKPSLTKSVHRSTFQDAMRQIVATVTPREVPTGLLYTPAYSLVDLSAYQGTGLAVPLSFRTWQQLYFEMSHSVSYGLALPPLQELRHRAQRATQKRRVPLVILDVRYNVLSMDELISRAQLSQRGNQSRAIYPEASVFAASLFRDQVRQGERVTVYLDPAFYLSQATELKRVSIDFDDGLGPRDLKMGGSVDVRYSDVGSKQVRVTVRDAKGHRRHSTFLLQVRPEQRLRPLIPNLIWVDRTANIPYLNEVASYHAYVFLGAGNERLTRPLLIVEGVDFDNESGWEHTIDRLEEVSLAQRLLSLGYDLVIVDFVDATDYVQRNSFALVHLIDTVIAERSGNQPLVVVGVSSGGVIGRYALSWMEAQGRAHETRLFASIDSPHQGANIPLGLQFWIAFFAEYSADADALLKILNSPAAQQLLVYHHLGMPGPKPHVLRESLLDELAQLGAYPSRSRNIAVANGSGAGIAATQLGDQEVPMSPGDLILNWHVDTLVLDIKGAVRAVPDDGPETPIFEGEFDLLFFDADRLQVSIDGTMPYDNAPGGWRDSQATLAATDPFLGDITTDFPQHAFVSTISALDLRDEAGAPLSLFHDLSRDSALAQRTPFDAWVYAPALQNESHVELTLENTTFLIEQLAVDE